MINTKIYKAVYSLSKSLLVAANKKNGEAEFAALYAELKAICVDNEDSPKDHPEQWETLADFTEDLQEAVAGYEKALVKAVAIDSKDHISSIGLSMATLQLELGQHDDAIENLRRAQLSAARIVDQELKREIDQLLKKLLSA